ncbi:hypothetical protein DFQ11_10673 [Winogradskyella epiphytica]|uniref:Uncharacterized protein n=1 Tax=Winogradskyella epiphytica TaxID=262005 RepID=A0A2V4XXA4_9FLAO|nr:hypothetical protein DFQ11_10673 [Winogradskyella epiphytica]GGW70226.1 hypothetical protein GCM10008085_22760 [Winogradskyella epiphytica]
MRTEGIIIIKTYNKKMASYLNTRSHFLFWTVTISNLDLQLGLYLNYNFQTNNLHNQQSPIRNQSFQHVSFEDY